MTQARPKTVGTRESYMLRREQAIKFMESERGKYAMAHALQFFIDIQQTGRSRTDSSKDTIEDIQYLLSTVYTPYLWGGQRWYGDSS